MIKLSTNFSLGVHIHTFLFMLLRHNGQTIFRAQWIKKRIHLPKTGHPTFLLNTILSLLHKKGKYKKT